MRRTFSLAFADRVAFLLLIAAVLVPAESYAKTLYVNSVTGNDAVSYDANSESTPWRTIGRAAWGSTNRQARNGAQAARAGDVVLVAAGTYTTAGTNTRNEVAYFTENNGTASAPIVFRAQGSVQLSLTNGIGPQIGAIDRDYIVWDGFTIHEASAPSAPDTGPVTVYGCNGCQLLNLEINGNGNANNRMDNHNGIRIEGSQNILVRNNRIQNVYTAHNVNNGAGIMVYASGAVTFEHNEIFNCGSGINLKGGPNTQIDFFTIRYNLIYNIGEVRNGTPVGNAIIMHAGAATTATRPTRIYQNIVRDSREAAVRIWRFSDTDITNTPMHGKIVNNTFYNVPKGIWVDNQPLANAGFVFWNNIVSNMSEGPIAFNGDPRDEARFDSEHNVFFSFPAILTTNASHTLAQWKSTFGQDTAAPASISADPRFVSAAGRDFHLAGDSPALSLGRDWLDLNGNGSTSDAIPAGAYVTGNEVIGRTSGGATPPTLPSAPANLRIIPPALQ